MKKIVLTACGALAAMLAVAPAAQANVPERGEPTWKAEKRWLRDTERRLERRLNPAVPLSAVGAPEVLFDVSPEGTILDATLVTPSGSPALDRMAMNAVAHTRGLRPPPQSFAGRPVRFRVEVRRRADFEPFQW